ncbi:hypothetical protein D3C71_1772030 [compost metagenome]
MEFLVIFAMLGGLMLFIAFPLAPSTMIYNTLLALALIPAVSFPEASFKRFGKSLLHADTAAMNNTRAPITVNLLICVVILFMSVLFMV